MRSGTIRGYAVTSHCVASAPEIPTVDEAGLPGLYISVWYGLWAPKGTAPEVVAKLSAAAREAMADPVVRARLAELGQEIPPREEQTPQALAARQEAEIAKWWPLVRDAHIKAE